ncbi:ABI gene family member 3 isoform X2 [Prionailurus viverrinus]|uniref:ABI gene family member 3 isoform X2 n=1 Tax=Prionailurus viverrinus TaxID=61388 RepID=UPI001FF535C0|nr:ABI gene family member 3 isoform X2 [Prionailurus viverrinus]
MAELQQLRELEIPTGREALRGNHSALLRVADYCVDNYVQVPPLSRSLRDAPGQATRLLPGSRSHPQAQSLVHMQMLSSFAGCLQATDKRRALEETMAFTTQALASVAYQVGNLAGHTLRMLDLQAASLRQVEARVNTLGQMVSMHMEKVARREIGTLATVQRLPPGQKVIAPDSLPPLTPYYRRPLNFGCLDDIGHGIKDLSTQLSRTGTLSRKSIKAPATPASATLGRPPRIPEPVQLPVVPDGKLSTASSASSLASAGAEGVGGVSATKGQAAPPPPPLPNPVAPPPPPATTEVFLPPPPLEEVSLPLLALRGCSHSDFTDAVGADRLSRLPQGHPAQWQSLTAAHCSVFVCLLSAYCILETRWGDRGGGRLEKDDLKWVDPGALLPNSEVFWGQWRGFPVHICRLSAFPSQHQSCPWTCPLLHPWTSMSWDCHICPHQASGQRSLAGSLLHTWRKW